MTHRPGRSAPRLNASPAARSAAAALGLLLAVSGISVLAGCRRGRPQEVRGPTAPAPPPAAPLMELRAVTPQERAGYVGSDACLECHKPEAVQIATHHAHTLAPADTADQLARFRAPGNQFDPSMNLRFQPAVMRGHGVLLARAGGRQSAAVADFAVGSGERGVTYLSRSRHGTVELRLSYYHGENRWDFSPRQPRGAPTDTPVGRTVDPAEEAQCFICHSTAVVTTNGTVAPERSLIGIGCERCHGPGRAHVDAARRNDPDLKMVHLSSDRRRVTMELCGTCHTSPIGDDLGNPVIAAQLARLQAPALALSACYQKSDLSCITCHEPHHDLKTGDTARYNRICGSCHTASHTGQVSCKVQPQGDCIRCHMPLQTVDLPTGPRYHNHWIGIWEAGAAPRARGSL